MTTSALRTPDSCFQALPDYAFAPHYLDNLKGYEGLRMHYLDEGPSDAAETFLCLHGQPTWSYLYRRMIPIFTQAGVRSIAPDLFGFGRSDKPVDDSVYTFTFHQQSLVRFVEALNITNVTLVCQDWGGLLGLTLPPAMPYRFNRLLVMNTGLGTGDMPLGPGFLAWRQWNNQNPDMDIAKLMGRSTPHLSPAERAAYAAPYPDIRYKGGVRRFPNLVPDHPEADGAALSRKAHDWWRNEWAGQTFMAIGMKDPVIGAPGMYALRKQIRNCPTPYEHAEAGHFVQEWGEDIARKGLAAFALNY